MTERKSGNAGRVVMEEERADLVKWSGRSGAAVPMVEVGGGRIVRWSVAVSGIGGDRARESVRQ
jgi:hypothetical protein